MIFTGGPPASGKNTILSMFLETEAWNEAILIIIDPDEIKRRLPEYIATSVDADYTERVSDFLHLESGDIAWRCFEEVLTRDKSFGVFVVTLSDYEWSEKMISQAKEAGFAVDLLFAYAPLEVCQSREEKRRLETKRGVPADVLERKHAEFSSHFGYIAALGDFVSLFNNSRDSSEISDDDNDEIVRYNRVPVSEIINELKSSPHIESHIDHNSHSKGRIQFSFLRKKDF